MHWRFRRRMKIAPGVAINFSKGAPSISLGGHGATLNISERGVKGTLGVPGSGLSVVTTPADFRAAFGGKGGGNAKRKKGHSSGGSGGGGAAVSLSRCPALVGVYSDRYRDLMNRANSLTGEEMAEFAQLMNEAYAGEEEFKRMMGEAAAAPEYEYAPPFANAPVEELNGGVMPAAWKWVVITLVALVIAGSILWQLFFALS